LHQVGVGALGPVFRTYEPTRDRLVAVKVFRLDIIPEQARSLADELSRAAEAGLFHPSIVEPIAAGIEGTLAYRAEEYVAAESLDVAMRHYAPAPIEKALPFITQLAGAIDFARAAGVGHGGLHPRDIFVTPDDARATGFGVVEALERAGIRAPVRRPYTAPERIERNEWGTPADVFSLAAIAFELLTGRRPAGTGKSIGALNTPQDAHTDAIHTVLARAMDDDPSRRYSNALAFAGALEQAAHAGRSDAGYETSTPSPRVATGPVIVPTAPTPAPRSIAPPPAPVTPTPGEFTVEEQLDPTHAALEDTLRSGSLFDSDAAASATLRPRIADIGEEPTAMGGLVSRPNDDESTVVDEPTIMDETTVIDETTVVKDPESAGRSLTSIHATGPTDFPAEPSFRDHAPAYGVDGEPRETPERAKPAILPIAVTLVVGLLVGFAAGYFVGGRDQGPNAATAVASTAGRTEAGAPTGNQPVRQFSDQAVTSAPAAAAPSTAARPSEPPPTVSEDSSSSPRPASPAPTPAPARSPAPAHPTSSTGRLVVHSTPTRASVTVNGRWRGRTPLTLDDLAFGHYVVRVVQPGYAIEREEFALGPQDAAHSMNVRLTPEKKAAPAATSQAPAARTTTPATQGHAAAPTSGTFTGGLFVDSRPQGANVMLDGNIVGKTPLRLPDVKIGTHVVRIELAEHRPWSSVVRITSGQQSRVTGSLERFQ
jgi:serine/threonine-protein kinase